MATSNDLQLINAELDHQYCLTDLAEINYGGYEFIIKYNPQTTHYTLYARKDYITFGKVYISPIRNKVVMMMFEYVASKDLFETVG